MGCPGDNAEGVTGSELAVREFLLPKPLNIGDGCVEGATIKSKPIPAL